VVEGHGTATPLGDPIEIGALLATYGRHRSPERPLLLGSVKSHLGHTQAAAGVAGVMKMVEALQHELLPRSLHAEEPTSRVDWSAGEVSLLTAPAPWPRCARPRRAGVSSFGIGGTNAHVILEEAPELPAATGDRGLLAVPWLLSAANAAALRALAAGLAGDSHDPLDVAYTLSTGRTPLAVRAVVPAGDRTALAELAAGRQSGSVVPPDARLALLFSGQGAQRPAMGADLARIFPVFADRFDEACAALDRHLGTSVRDVAFAAESPLLDRTDFTQAALFAFEVALYRLVESWGVQPVMLAGHSIGELAAAHVAGVLSLADAATLVAARGRLMAGLPTGGAMFAVEAAEHEVLPLVAMAPTEISVAAVNGPLSIVVSGEENAARAAADEFAGRGRRTSRLRVSHAFHSPLIDPMLGEFRAVADSLSYATPRIDIVSGVLGRRATPAELCSPGYWVDHARQAIRFGDALTALRDANVTMALEIGPDTTLARLASVTLPAVAATRTAEPESTALLAAMGALWASGHSVDWPAVFAGSGARTVPLPTYPFQRRRYWLDPPTPGDDNAHPLLGAALPAPDSGRIVHGGSVSVRTQHWLTDHVVGDTVVVPGAALVEIMLQAGIEAGVPHLREATMVAPLVLASDMQLQVTLGEAGSGERQVDLYARQGTEPWTCHASGILGGAKPAPPPDDEPWPPPAAEPVDLDGRYARLAEVGLRYGPAFRAVTATWRRGDEVFAEVRLPPGVSGRFGVHPVLLDAAVHASALVHADGDALHVPYAWCGVEIHATGATRIRVRCVRVGPDEIAVDLRDESGRPVATVGSMRTRPAGPHIPNVVRRGLFRPYWTPVTTSPGQRTGWTVTGDDVFGLADILPRDGTRPGHVLQVAGTDGEHVPGAVRARTADVLEGLQSWQRTAEGARLLVVTTGATGSRPDLAAAAVLGLVGSAQAEHPELITLVDIDASPASRRALPAAVDGNEPRLSIRDGIVYRQRLVRAAPAASSPEFGGGTVLVTGGTGALGALVARHLVADLVVRHVVLLSRRGPDAPGAERLGTELRDLGATVRIVAGDAADRATVEEIVATCEPALTGIVHTAGVIDAGILSSLDNDRLARVLAPKVDAAWTLHEATAHLQLTRFVLFSSISGVLGQAGQANYAAANTCLDALAVHRRALGLPALSLAWGPWEHGGGMAGDLPATVRRRMTATGLTAMTDEEGLALFDAALDAREPVLVPALLGPPTSDVPPLLADLVPRRTPLRIRAAEGTWRQLFVGLDAAERRHRLTELVRAELADILGYTEPAEFPLDEPFSTLGFDSLAATLARGRLAERCGLSLPVTVLFDHPTCTDLATHLDTALGTERRP
ncbi:MAG TPA: type I polyketide synthase, partial [Pseudonocardiaceae bacterium]